MQLKSATKEIHYFVLFGVRNRIARENKSSTYFLFGFNTKQNRYR